jgi:hypothetical protein
MATRKTRKKQAKRKKTAAMKPPKKTARKKLLKKAAPRKTSAKKPATHKIVAKTKTTKTKTSAAKNNRAKTADVSRKRVQAKRQNANLESFADEEAKTRSAGQSGSLQGLSNAAGADSESVDELIEEGNAFEAGVVSGVEAADRADEQEVRTHEVPEDDVPDEYRNQD